MPGIGNEIAVAILSDGCDIPSDGCKLRRKSTVRTRRKAFAVRLPSVLAVAQGERNTQLCSGSTAGGQPLITCLANGMAMGR